MASKKKKRYEVTVELPDLGLTARQLSQLSKAFENELVATMSGRSVGVEAVADPVRKFITKKKPNAV